jgi:hypothetical protein
VAHLRVLACLPSLLEACLVLSLAAADHQHSNVSLRKAAAAAAAVAAHEQALKYKSEARCVAQPATCSIVNLVLCLCSGKRLLCCAAGVWCSCHGHGSSDVSSNNCYNRLYCTCTACSCYVCCCRSVSSCSCNSAACSCPGGC